MKKVISLLVSALSVLGIAFCTVGCGGSGGSAGEANVDVTFPLKESVTLKLMVMGTEDSSFKSQIENNGLWKRMKKETNVNVEFQFLGTEPSEKLTLLINSGNYGDATGMRIYSRGGSGELATCDAEIEQGKAYNVKAVFQGNRIDAYLDGVKMLTATDNDYQIGFAGIRYIGSTTGTGITTTIDNFVVYDYDIIPAPTPNKVENFDDYTPSYLEDGVTYDKQYIQKAGWGSSSNAMLTNYVPYFAEGRLTIPTTADNDVNLFLNTTKAKEWQNYSVSWDIRSDANSSGTYIFLGGRITDYKTGYFLKIYMGSSGHIREIHLQDKYKGNDIGTALVGTKTGYYCPETSLRPLCSTAFTVKMEFNGTSIKVYLNDTLIIEATDETYTKGSIAMNAGINSTANNSAIEVDNITVFDFDNLDQYVKEIVGDFNGDQLLDADDMTVIIGRLLQDSGEADINKDGVTDIRDAVRIKRILESF